MAYPDGYVSSLAPGQTGLCRIFFQDGNMGTPDGYWTVYCDCQKPEDVYQDDPHGWTVEYVEDLGDVDLGWTTLHAIGVRVTVPADLVPCDSGFGLYFYQDDNLYYDPFGITCFTLQINVPSPVWNSGTQKWCYDLTTTVTGYLNPENESVSFSWGGDVSGGATIGTSENSITVGPRTLCLSPGQNATVTAEVHITNNSYCTGGDSKTFTAPPAFSSSSGSSQDSSSGSGSSDSSGSISSTSSGSFTSSESSSGGTGTPGSSDSSGGSTGSDSSFDSSQSSLSLGSDSSANGSSEGGSSEAGSAESSDSSALASSGESSSGSQDSSQNGSNEGSSAESASATSESSMSGSVESSGSSDASGSQGSSDGSLSSGGESSISDGSESSANSSASTAGDSSASSGSETSTDSSEVGSSESLSSTSSDSQDSASSDSGSSQTSSLESSESSEESGSSTQPSSSESGSQESSSSSDAGGDGSESSSASSGIGHSSNSCIDCYIPPAPVIGEDGGTYFVASPSDVPEQILLILQVRADGQIEFSDYQTGIWRDVRVDLDLSPCQWYALRWKTQLMS